MPCHTNILNRGSPPQSFLNELVAWGQNMPDDIVEFNNNDDDIFDSILDELGPWDGFLHRKAAMLEVLRVLGGFESSWNWNEGPDLNNPSSNTPVTEEAGIFQCSANSMNFDSSLKNLVLNTVGTTEGKAFQAETKANHEFALEYCARLLRFTTRHHGPITRNEIHSWLSRDCVDEFSQMLAGGIV